MQKKPLSNSISTRAPFYWATMGVLVILLMIPMTVRAQNVQADDNDLMNMRFSRVMVPVDAVTLKTEGVEIRLWGILPSSTSETQLELRALQTMQRLIGSGEVNCRIMPGGSVTHPYARCMSRHNEDIGLTLLQQGLAVRDRRALYGSVFASSYEEAENIARRNKNGIWAFVETDRRSRLIRNIVEDENKLLLIALMFIGLPLLAMLIMGFSVRHSVNRLLKYQNKENSQFYNRNMGLNRREKDLLLSRIKTELEENKNRVEAFLTVYQEMLSDIKDQNKTPKYQQSGDTVSLHPSFSRAAFEETIEKLAGLDMKLAAELQRFYANMPSDGTYSDLSPDMPRDEATTMVDGVVNNAREYLPMLDRAITMVEAYKGNENEN